MQVFKLYVQLLKRHSKSLLLYMGIFLSVFIIFGVMSHSINKTGQFNETKPSITIVDQDQSPLSQSLIKFLELKCKIESVDETNLEDALFYGQVSCIVTIQPGFSEDYSAITTLKRENEATSMLTEQYINDYLNTFNSYQTLTDLDMNNIHEKIMEQHLSSNQISFFEGTSQDIDGKVVLRQSYFNYASYVIICAMITIVSLITKSLNDKEIRKRNTVAPIKSIYIPLQSFIGHLIFTILLWLVFIIVILLLGSDLSSPVGLTYTLNSFIFSLVALSISFLCASFTINHPHSDELISSFTNIIGLGMAFLGGAFVPQMMLSESVLRVSRFIPSYWYVLINDKLVEMTQPTTEIFKYMGIQCLFAGAFFVLGLIVFQHKQRKF